MGDHSVKFRGFSLAPRAGYGMITNGRFVDFKSEFPNGATRLVGGELTLDLEGLKAGKPIGRIGQLALVYYWGYLKEHFDQNDLPLGDLGNIFQFSSTRESNSHYIFAEWRWDSFQPLFRNKHVSFIQPRFSLGAGAYNIKTILTEGDADPTTINKWGFIATGATHLQLLALRFGNFQLALDISVRLFAGQTFGVIGEAAFRMGYVAPKTVGP